MNRGRISHNAQRVHGRCRWALHLQLQEHERVERLLEQPPDPQAALVQGVGARFLIQPPPMHRLRGAQKPDKSKHTHTHFVRMWACEYCQQHDRRKVGETLRQPRAFRGQSS